MKDISELDKNFRVETKIQREGLKFYNVLSEPFSIHGVFYDGEIFRRVPDDVAKEVSDGVRTLSRHTAGGRVRFKTTSSYIAVYYKGVMWKMPHFAFSGSCGMDVYFSNDHVGTFMPDMQREDGYESIMDFENSDEKQVTINLPLYSEVHELYIGLDENATLERADEYKYTKPIVYYGSSITQGGCASRPGTSYQARISRHFDCDYINLGFSGNARGEDAIADYISSLEMSHFVFDYDHNAPSVAHLEKTHERMFLRIREKHPTLPIIIMPRPKNVLSEEEKRRFEIIKSTYLNAKARGDENVYFIDNVSLCALCGSEGTVDICHPTDFGFASMANALIPLLFL